MTKMSRFTVSIPKRRIFLPLFLFCAYDSSVLQNFKIFTHFLPHFSHKDPRLTKWRITALTSTIGSGKFQKFKYGTFMMCHERLWSNDARMYFTSFLYKIVTTNIFEHFALQSTTGDNRKETSCNKLSCIFIFVYYGE
jgi:hypothetical protein